MMRFAVVVLVLVGCGDGSNERAGADAANDAPRDAPALDATPDSAIDAAIDAPPDAPVDAPPDAYVDPNAPTIATVATADGFTQMCHGCEDEIVITGTKLDTVTWATLGGVDYLWILSQTPTELHVEMYLPGGYPPGPVALTLTSTVGTVTKPSAIEVTPKVISPLAPTSGGHATYVSPSNLCDVELMGSCNDCRRKIKALDTVLLLAGSHSCNYAIDMPDGAKLQGAGIANTSVTFADGAFVFYNDTIDPQLSEVHDLTLHGTSPNGFFSGIEANGGELLVERVAQTGGGIRATQSSGVTVAHYTLAGVSTVNAIDVEGDSGTLAVSNATISDCATGIGLDFVHESGMGLSITDTTIRRCRVGVQIGKTQGTFSAPDPGTTVTNLQLLDNTTGIAVVKGTIDLTAVTITDDEATPPATTIGIAIGNGDLTMHGGQITGQTTGVTISSQADTFPTITLVATTITGGNIGVYARSLADFLRVTMRGATVKEQTVAALQLDGEEGVCDLGTAGDPGNNALSVTSGFAIDDLRIHAQPCCELMTAVGTTLDGTSYAGQLLAGPLTQSPNIRIATAAGVWQF